MGIRTKQFQPLTDVETVWRFMTEVYAPDGANGAPAPFFEYALTSSWMDKSYLSLDRLWLDGETPVAFAFAEDPCTSVYVNLRPGYEALAEAIVEYGEGEMPNFGREKEFVLYPGQEALIRAVQARGYALAWEETAFAFDFGAGRLDFPLPEGFHFVDPLACDPEKLAMCAWKGFGHGDADGIRWKDPVPPAAWSPQKSYYGILGAVLAPAPHATHAHDVIIADSSGAYACYSGMWWVAENGLAYMEPLCTVPEYRRMGLAAAALSAHDRRLRPLGARLMTGGDHPFYKSIGYNREIRRQHWKRAV